jgi:hypothetical protein
MSGEASRFGHKGFGDPRTLPCNFGAFGVDRKPLVLEVSPWTPDVATTR